MAMTVRRLAASGLIHAARTRMTAVEYNDQTKIGSYLFSRHRIFTTPIVHEEFTGLRITPNLYTTLGELDRFCEAMAAIEGTKGNNGYYLISDGGTGSYRTRIRTPSFAHMQMLPLLCRGLMIPDLLAILGSLDYVLADIDR